MSVGAEGAGGAGVDPGGTEPALSVPAGHSGAAAAILTSVKLQLHLVKARGGELEYGGPVLGKLKLSAIQSPQTVAIVTRTVGTSELLWSCCAEVFIFLGT